MIVIVMKRKEKRKFSPFYSKPAMAELYLCAIKFRESFVGIINACIFATKINNNEKY